MTPSERNKKQQLLRNAGYNVTVGGPWGPWQEQQYQKLIRGQRPLTNEEANRLSRGYATPVTLANPGAAVGALGTLGTIEAATGYAAPTLANLAFTAPAALVAAGPLYGAYEAITGQTHIVPTTPKQDQARVYSADATRINRPVPISIPRTYDWDNSRPMGEMYVNPAVIREESIYLAKGKNKNKNKNKGVKPNPPADQGGATAEPVAEPVVESVTAPASAPTAPANPPEQKPENENKKEENKEQQGNKGDNKGNTNNEDGFGAGFKEEFKGFGKKMGKYVGKGIKWGTGLGLVGGAAAGGAYLALHEDPTPADSLLEATQKSLKEYYKLKEAQSTQKQIDSLRRDLLNVEQTTPKQSTNYEQQLNSAEYPASPDSVNVNQLDSLMKARNTKR